MMAFDPGAKITAFEVLAPVVLTLDSAIHRINHYLADSVIDFFNTYPLDSDLSGGLCYPTFEQPRPGNYALRHITISCD